MTDQNEFTENEEEKKINVQIAQVKSKKVYTVLIGVPTEQRESILKHLKKSIGCGGNINKETGHVQLQGNYAYKIDQELNKLLPEYEVVLGSVSKF